ncbi:Trans-1,2-dihydrobenzene-1,2-diol dehydrogenase [Aphelenchoides fujianensis]|nr:Trans-1,2-dihydrobenzene-1,2-diol dehydrogenase [Aphelenchoides fujianensis]
MRTLKWGIIGCGNIASDFVHALRNSAYDHRVRLTAIQTFNGYLQATHFHLNIAGRNPRFNLSTCEVPTLSTGVYCVSLAFFLFGESPVRIHAVGEKNEEGFEEWCNLSLVFADGKHATLYFGRACLSAWTAYIACTKGQIQVHNFCWAPTEFTKINGPIRVGATKSETFEYPLPDDHSKYFFNHSQGLVYEADHVFEMLQKGRTESEIMPLDTSLKIAGVLDEIRRQLEVRFPQDDERHA